MKKGSPYGVPKGSQNMNFGCAGFRILPLYRHTKKGSYFEIGPEFGWIQTSYFTDEANGPIPDNSLFQEKNIKNWKKKNNEKHCKHNSFSMFFYSFYGFYSFLVNYQI